MEWEQIELPKVGQVVIAEYYPKRTFWQRLFKIKPKPKKGKWIVKAIHVGNWKGTLK